MKINPNISIFWFRRDLRLKDNKGLFYALKNKAYKVVPLFIFDSEILDKLEKNDPRVTFIYKVVKELKNELKQLHSDLLVYHGSPIKIWQYILYNYNVAEVYTNKEYEPYTIQRDQLIKNLLVNHNIPFFEYKDHVIFEQDEILNNQQKPYTVFTPYRKKWIKKLVSQNPDLDTLPHLRHYPSESFCKNYFRFSAPDLPDIKTFGFKSSNLLFPSKVIHQGLINSYDKTRDFPAINGTSKLGIHFRYGTISIRQKTKKALALNQSFLFELIWRDFYSQILYHFPYVAETAFRPAYRHIPWINDESQFERWKQGNTGYPLIDAAMRQLNTTGWMHNRLRMNTASFLTKHLLIDYRWGEAYFEQKLIDFDLASNNGGWQWAAGSGTDAAPYFRIFNPTLQQKKFDPNFDFIKIYVPEYQSDNYVKPIVNHKEARLKTIALYKTTLQQFMN